LRQSIEQQSGIKTALLYNKYSTENFIITAGAINSDNSFKSAARSKLRFQAVIQESKLAGRPRQVDSVGIPALKLRGIEAGPGI
jgi:hypothetical protein